MHQGLYVESINVLTKEFLSQKTFDAFMAGVRSAFNELLARDEVEKDTIRKAIVDFMQQRGMKAIVVFVPRGIAIKCSIINRYNNAYIDFLMRFLEEQGYIHRLKNGDNSCLKEIFLLLQHAQLPNDMTRDIVRGALKRILGLHDRDGVFFCDLEPLVKNFDFELVQNNAQIRAMIKADPAESLLDEATKSHINQALKDKNLELIMKQIAKDIVDSRLETMSTIDFWGAFSFLYVRHFIEQLVGLLGSGFSVGVLNCYGVELYRERRWQICEEIAQEVLHRLDSGDMYARAFVGFFNGHREFLNGREFYIPVIEDVESTIWGLNDIEFILHSERNINQALQQYRHEIHNAQKRLLAIDQEVRDNNDRICEKQEQIQALSQEYEEQKAQAIAYEKSDIQTRNAMTKTINSLLQHKIHILDYIASLKNNNTALQEEKYTLQNTQKNAQAEMVFITRKNKHSIERFHNLLRALGGCIATIIADVDSYA